MRRRKRKRSITRNSFRGPHGIEKLEPRQLLTTIFDWNLAGLVPEVASDNQDPWSQTFSAPHVAFNGDQVPTDFAITATVTSNLGNSGTRPGYEGIEELSQGRIPGMLFTPQGPVTDFTLDFSLPITDLSFRWAYRGSSGGNNTYPLAAFFNSPAITFLNNAGSQDTSVFNARGDVVLVEYGATPITSITVSNIPNATGFGVDTIIGELTFNTPQPTLPGVVSSAATRVTGTTAILNGDVSDDGNAAPEVTIYWGTEDGDTIAANWDHALALGVFDEGPFSAPIFGLTPETTYFYRAFASNSAGQAWASNTESFTTLSVTVPAVVNQPVTGLGASIATLRGQVLATGNDEPTVQIYWGDNDGGTDVAAWDEAVNVGRHDLGAFASTITGLERETTYFFRARAENVAGIAWAPSSDSFVTLAEEVASVAITEFQALDTRVLNNDGTIQTDQDDWLELFNSSPASVDLTGWYLTDNANNLNKWEFPLTQMDPGKFLVVFASGRDEVDGNGQLHTNFRLGTEGYLALVLPDGQTAVSEHGTGGEDYPQQFQDVSYGIPQNEGPLSTRRGFFLTPTPGAENTQPVHNTGPTISDVTHTPNVPVDNENLVVTARVISHNTATVQLHYRVMYGTEQTVAMLDNGVAPDLAAGDRLFTATIPAPAYASGEMVRYYITADDDVNGFDSREPAFLDSTGDVQSPEYYGTVVQDSAIDTQLQILQWFTNDVSGVDDPGATTRGVRDDDSGGRSSFFYLGEFYDNTFVRTRGWSARLFNAVNPPKLSYVVEFNPQQPFQYAVGADRVEEIKINSPIMDKSFIRHTLASETYVATGVPVPFALDPVRVERNNQFFGVSIVSEESNSELLDRLGLDPRGELIKHGIIGAQNRITDLANIRKKTRRDEDFSALQQLVNGLALSGTAEEAFLFDNLDVPSVINYMAVTHGLLSSFDNTFKNYMTYRDTEGDGEWQMLTFDYDPAFGNPPNSNDFPTDPMKDPIMNSGNAMMGAIYENPRLREMYFRRIRTLADQFFSPNQRQAYQDRIDELIALVEPDSVLDIAKWGTKDQDGIDIDMRTNALGIMSDYIVPRYDYLIAHPEVPADDVVIVTTTFLDENASARILVPSPANGGDQLGDSWKGGQAFDDTSWIDTLTGIGYDVNDDYDRLFGYPGNGAIENQIIDEMRNAGGGDTQFNESIFVRIPFSIDIASLGESSSLTLQMRVEDGFAAYINGVEVAAVNAPAAPTWNSGATAQRSDAAAIVRQSFDLLPFVNDGTIVSGDNILAIQGLNFNATSSDLLVLPEIVSATTIDNPDESPSLEFGQIDHNPLSSNQDEEFIEIVNNELASVDMSGWRLTGGVEFTFPPGTVLLGGESLYVSPDVTAFRARGEGPTGGERHFVVGGYRGHLSNEGETIQLLDSSANVNATTATPGDLSDAQRFLRVSEVHYNPAGSGDTTEFLEVQNTSDSVTLDLSGVAISQGPSTPFGFTGSFVTSLAPGQFALVVKDVSAFTTAYPDVDAGIIAGQFAGSLSNSGERIKLDDATGSTIVDFTYGDDSPWPEPADGAGGSIELVDPAGTARSLVDKFYNWQGSAEFGGTPGRAPTTAPQIVIHEVLAHTDPPVSQMDSVELFNAGDSAIDISNWYLSDSDEDLLKFRIPAGTSLDPGEYIVFDESDFNPTPLTPGPKHFALSGVEGDDVWLVISDGAGGVATFVDSVHFGASLNGETLGRVVPEGDRLSPMSRDTLGCGNSHPRVGPLVITEIHYNPGFPSPSALALSPTLEPDDLEFIEIHNPTTSVVDLSDWRVRGGADINFDDGTQMAAGETLTIVSFNPDNPLNATRLAAFRAHYGIDASVRLNGGYNGRLSDNYEEVRLERPDTPPLDDPTFTPHVAEDTVLYDDFGPWPIDADGGGSSLRRLSPTAFADTASSWHADPPTPGSVDFSGNLVGDFTSDGLTNAADIDVLYDAIHAGSSVGFYDLDGNSVVERSDVVYLIESILGTRLGDADLDGSVDSIDFDFWNMHGFQSCTGWAQADFNGDGTTDGSDFNMWNQNKFAAEPGAPAAQHNREPRAPLSATGTRIAPDVLDRLLGIEPRVRRPNDGIGQEMTRFMDVAHEEFNRAEMQRPFRERYAGTVVARESVRRVVSKRSVERIADEVFGSLDVEF